MKKLLIASACVIALSSVASAQTGSGPSAGSTAQTQAGGTQAKDSSNGAMRNNTAPSGTTGAATDNMKRDKVGVPGNDAAGSGAGGGAIRPGAGSGASNKAGGG